MKMTSHGIESIKGSYTMHEYQVRLTISKDLLLPLINALDITFVVMPHDNNFLVMIPVPSEEGAKELLNHLKTNAKKLNMEYEGLWK